MATRSERLSADAYTRASVEAYLQAVAEERVRIELAIAEERRRRDEAQRSLDRLDAVGGLPAGWAPPEQSATPVASGE
ncbi:MAG: hypothetical protein ABSF84_15910 [Acidimicrobiales bacterium]